MARRIGIAKDEKNGTKGGHQFTTDGERVGNVFFTGQAALDEAQRLTSSDAFFSPGERNEAFRIANNTFRIGLNIKPKAKGDKRSMMAAA